MATDGAPLIACAVGAAVLARLVSINRAVRAADVQLGAWMQPIGGFSIGKRLAATPAHEVYAAVREADGRRVTLKRARSARESARLRLEREYEALRELRGPGVIEALELHLEPECVLVLEHVDGCDLAAWWTPGQQPIGPLLDVAVALTGALAHVHARRWIHSELSPTNVMVGELERSVRLIDFGSARRLGEQAEFTVRSKSRADVLLYVAPEQTAWLDRGVDARSDLYSLGAVLYHLLTGEPPFRADDATCLMHAHLARVPVAPAERCPELGGTLSRMLLKLLEKDPDDRYPSATALRRDLEICRDQLAREGRIEEGLQLGGGEGLVRPRFPTRLYGRERETALLASAYERALQGSTRVVMLSGDPGSGKSSLIDLLRNRIAETSGTLARGKCEESRERPYGVWTDVLGHWAQQLLIESDASLARWRERLCGSLGSIAGVLVELVPDLGFVLGEVDRVPDLGARETEARLALAIRRVTAAFAARDHPMVLFFDDLQWSDEGSLAVLEDLIAHLADACLLIVGTHHGVSSTANRPIDRFVERLGVLQVPFDEVTVGPLELSASTQWLADVFERPAADMGTLGALIQRKTGNVPLFLRQFIEHIHAQGLLHYASGFGWKVDMDALARAEIPDGAAGLITTNLHRLRPDVRRVLELAACVGDEFDIELLSQLKLVEVESVAQSVYVLADQGLIVPCPRGFRFAHGRIRESARQLSTSDERALLHYEISKRLLELSSEAEREQRLLEIVDHLDAGVECLEAHLRGEAIQLNLSAGEAALKAGSPSLARRYLEFGRQIFSEEDWSESHSLGVTLFLRSVECAILCGEFERAREFIATARERRLSPMEFARLAAWNVQLLALTQSAEACADYALDALRELGVEFSRHPRRWRVARTMRRLLWRIRGDRFEAAFRLNTSPDPSWAAPIVVLGASGAVMSRVDQGLAALSSSWVLASNLEHGCLARPAFSLAGLATSVVSILEDAPTAERLARIALERQHLYSDPTYTLKLGFYVHGVVRPWCQSRHDALEPLLQIANAQHELGDREGAYYSRFVRGLMLALCGNPVEECLRDLSDMSEEIRRGANAYREPELCLRPYRLLQIAEPSEIDWQREIAASEDELQAYGFSGEAFVRTCWMLVLGVHGLWHLGFDQSRAIEGRLMLRTPLIHVADHLLWRGLAAAELALGSSGGERRRLRRVVRDCARRLERRQRHGPDFVHMALLLAAEQARLSGRFDQAYAQYERAARAASQARFTSHVAIALERRGRMCLEARKREAALSCLQQARDVYASWGVAGKVRALEREQESLRA